MSRIAPTFSHPSPSGSTVLDAQEQEQSQNKYQDEFTVSPPSQNSQDLRGVGAQFFSPFQSLGYFSARSVSNEGKCIFCSHNDNDHDRDTGTFSENYVIASMQFELCVLSGHDHASSMRVLQEGIAMGRVLDMLVGAC